MVSRCIRCPRRAQPSPLRCTRWSRVRAPAALSAFAHRKALSGGSAATPRSGAFGSGAIGGIGAAVGARGSGVPPAATGSTGLTVVVVSGALSGSQSAGIGARKLHGAHSHWQFAGGGGSCCSSAMHKRARGVTARRVPVEAYDCQLTLSSVALVPFAGGGGGGGVGT